LLVSKVLGIGMLVETPPIRIRTRRVPRKPESFSARAIR
jgi:hypothetical protein